MPVMRRVMRGALSVSLAIGAFVTSSAAWSADPLPPAGVGGVDAALEADLLEGLGDLKLPPPQKIEPAPAPAAPERSAPPVDAPSVEELRGLLQQEGEDLGSAGESPTERIGEMMRSVEERFVSKDSSETTQQIQEDIVTQLRAMLEQQEKKCSQCSGGQCDSPNSSSSSTSKSGGSKPGQSKPGDSKPKPGSPDEQGKEPTDSNQQPDAESESPKNPGDATDPQASSAPGATDSEDRLDASRLEEVLRRSAADFDELWGQLPPQVQQRLKQGLTERTLPQYEPMIEAYYRRLAEDSGEAR